MEDTIRESSQAEMLKEQIQRVDEEMLIFLKRRIQTSKKLAEAVKKTNGDFTELDEFSDALFKKATMKSKEMGIDTLVAHDLFALLDDECRKTQKKVFEK